MALANIAILSADNSSQYQLSSQTGACSARHSLRPQTGSRANNVLIILLYVNYMYVFYNHGNLYIFSILIE